MRKKDYAQIAKIAAEAVKDIDENLQPTAFAKIMDDLLGSNGDGDRQFQSASAGKPSMSPQKHALSGKDETLQEFTRRLNPKNDNQRYLGIVYYCEHSEDSKGITHEEIMKRWIGKRPSNPPVLKKRLYDQGLLRKGNSDDNYIASQSGEKLIDNLLSGDPPVVVKKPISQKTKKKANGEVGPEKKVKEQTKVKKKVSGNSKIKNQAKPDEIVQQAIDGIDSTKYPKLYKVEKVFDKSLYILKVVKDVLNIDGLSTTQIARILTEKFRIKTSPQAVNEAVKKSADKLNKVGAKYQIMRAGEVELEKVIKIIDKA